MGMKAQFLFGWGMLFGVYFLSSSQAFAEAQVGDHCAGRPLVKMFYIKNAGPSEVITFNDFLLIGSEQEKHKLDIQEVTQFPFKILGAGIRSEITDESVALACVGMASGADSEPQCDCVRPIYYNPQTQRIYSFGNTMRLYDIDKHPNFEMTRRDLKKSLHAVMRSMDQVHARNNFLRDLVKNAKPFSLKDGWNWSANPISVSDRRFLKITGELGADLMVTEERAQFIQAQAPDSLARRFFLNPYMVRLVPPRH